MKTKHWWIGLGGLVLLALVAFALRIVIVDRRLTERPEQRVGETELHELASFVAVSIHLRYDALAQLLDEQFPSVIEIPEASLLGQRSPMTSVQGAGTVERKAPIRVTGAGEGVLASTHLQASYTLGNALLGSETVQAEAGVALATAFDITEEWKPVVSIQPGFEWVKPPESRLTRMFNLSLSGVAEQQVQNIVGRMEARLPQLMEERFNLSQNIEQAWGAAHARLPLAEAPAIWLDIQPLGAHFITPVATDDALVLQTGFSANFNVSSDPAVTAPAPTPLPPLGKQPPAVDGIRLAVPVGVDYQTLSDRLTTALLPQTFAFDVGQDSAEVRIDEIVVYPSAPQLTIGLHVGAEVSRQWLDTRGWIYLSATPVYDAETRRLSFTDVRFARSVDNRWVRLLSSVLRDRLIREIEQHAQFDLAGPIDLATQAANSMLHAQLQQVLETRLQGSQLRLAERIAVEGGFDGIESASFELGEAGITLYPVVTGSLRVQLVPVYSTPAPVESQAQSR